mmetsp:Transcript_2656/g.6789  ORF Transcript_2656/g.6789 Transcript_2656/m.6789 type:complete len:213 (+) Transcript_2656:2906-3544(+)
MGAVGAAAAAAWPAAAGTGAVAAPLFIAGGLPRCSNPCSSFLAVAISASSSICCTRDTRWLCCCSCCSWACCRLCCSKLSWWWRWWWLWHEGGGLIRGASMRTAGALPADSSGASGSLAPMPNICVRPSHTSDGREDLVKRLPREGLLTEDDRECTSLAVLTCGCASSCGSRMRCASWRMVSEQCCCHCSCEDTEGARAAIWSGAKVWCSGE